MGGGSAFASSGPPWRSIDDPGIDGQSVRWPHPDSVYIAALSPESITVQWAGRRATSTAPMQDPRLEWHLVTSGTFVAADNVESRTFCPCCPAPTWPWACSTPERDPPIAAWPRPRRPGRDEFEDLHGYPSTTPPRELFLHHHQPEFQHPIDYKTQAEPWLYAPLVWHVRALHAQWFATALREAVRSTDFYVDHLTRPAPLASSRAIKNTPT